MATFDSGLKLTQAGIPVSLRPFFQEYALEDLDPEHNAPEVRELLAILGQLPFCARSTWPSALVVHSKSF